MIKPAIPRAMFFGISFGSFRSQLTNDDDEPFRVQYKMGRTLVSLLLLPPPLIFCYYRSRKKIDRAFARILQGAGTYGIVREADGPEGKVAVKIILKKNVKGNEQMVYDELKLLQRLHHPHIVQFRDWFESRVKTCYFFCSTRAVIFCSSVILIHPFNRTSTISLLS